MRNATDEREQKEELEKQNNTEKKTTKEKETESKKEASVEKVQSDEEALAKETQSDEEVLVEETQSDAKALVKEEEIQGDVEIVAEEKLQDDAKQLSDEEREKEEREAKRAKAQDSSTFLLGRIGDILILHFCILIGSLPIITMGASLTAGSYVGMKLASGMEGYVFRNFMKAFKQNFKRSTLYWLVCVVAALAIYNSYRYWMLSGGATGLVLGVTSVILAVLLFMTMLYLFAVQAKFENTFKATLKNAFLMSIRHFHITLLMIVIIVFMGYLMVEFVPMQAIGVVSGFGILSLAFGKLYNMVFNIYINASEK